MQIAVLGAGVVGVAAAYYLARDGHEVTVIDRHDDVAMGSSFSNAGLVSPGDAAAWASPAALKTLLKSRFARDSFIRIRPGFDPYFARWARRFVFQCSTARFRANSANKLRLALYSRACMDAIAAVTGIDYDKSSKGIVYFFRSQQSFDSGAENLRFLAQHGLEIEVIDRDRLVQIEPGLAAAKNAIAGGIYSPTDQTGDSRMFSQNLARYCRDHLAVAFRFGANIGGLELHDGRVSAVRTSRGRVQADAFVIALGPESGLLGRRHGIDLPIYPAKGYAATVALADASRGPTMGGVDEDRFVAWSRLGNRLRLASTVEFAGFDRSCRPGDFERMFATADEVFGIAIDRSKAELWAGLRPMMPNSVPVIGRARFDNLYLNTGHGHVGWTMAAGSGRFLADLVAGRQPEIDPAGLTPRN